jgi:hypothetical protein
VAERAAVEAHLSTCSECQQALVAYRRFDALVSAPLRLGDGGAGPLADFQLMLLEETMLTTDPNTPSAPRRLIRQRPRTPLTALGAIAAVLLIAILAGTFFTYFRAPRRPVTATVPALTWRQATLPNGFVLPVPNGNQDDAFAISPADGQRAWACMPDPGQPGAIAVWATHDAAKTWRQVSALAPQLPAPPQWCELMPDQYDAHTLITALGRDPCRTCGLQPYMMSWLSTDDGATWQALPGESGLFEEATNNGTIYALVGDPTKVQAFQLATITRDGGTLSVHPTGSPAGDPGEIDHISLPTSLWMHPPDQVLYAADAGAHFWRSDDVGVHWTALGLPQGAVAVENSSATDPVHVFGRWIEREHHWLFCVTSFSAVQCSDDGGLSWPARLARQMRDVAVDCYAASAITADGQLLAACSSFSVSPNDWWVLTLLAPGSRASRQIGAVPSSNFTLTATGQIWGFNWAGDAVYVATLRG